MAEPILPSFADSGQYVRYFGSNVVVPTDTSKMFRYARLLESDGPLRYPYKFASVAVDATTASTEFRDLEPAVGHIYQAFLGINPGVRMRLSHPFDTRLLKWDQVVNAISDDDTAVLTHGLTPYDAPQYSIWIPPNKQYPALVAQNATANLLSWPSGKSINPRIIWIAKVFRVEDIQQESQPEIYDMLVKKKIPSTPISFGGSIRAIPR